jgi:hypothetical protein
MVTRYELDDRGGRSLGADRERIFSSPCHPDRLWGTPSLTNRCWPLFPQPLKFIIHYKFYHLMIYNLSYWLSNVHSGHTLFITFKTCINHKVRDMGKKCSRSLLDSLVSPPLQSVHIGCTYGLSRMMPMIPLPGVPSLTPDPAFSSPLSQWQAGKVARWMGASRYWSDGYKFLQSFG